MSKTREQPASVGPRERPILFSAPMVRAILAGTKTQTRRVVKPQPNVVHAIHADASIETNLLFRRGDQRIHCPYGKPGDRLWVRETWQDVHPIQVSDGRYSQEGRAGIPGPPSVEYRTIYRADGEYPAIHHERPDGTHVGEWPYRALCIGDECRLKFHYAESRRPGYWQQSNHMPRWASRITLEITDVRVQRLQEITGEDVEAEGVEFPDATHITKLTERWRPFRDLWDSINARKAPWQSNPWVWAITFKRVQP